MEDPRLAEWARESGISSTIPPRYGSAEHGRILESIAEDQKQLDALFQQIRDLRFEMSKKRIAASAARTLPLDVLSHTFSYLDYKLPLHARYINSLAAVSRHWRDACFHTPSLWSKYSLGNGFWMPSSEVFETWLTNARKVPLKLSLSSMAPITPGLQRLLKSHAAGIGEIENGIHLAGETRNFYRELLGLASNLSTLCMTAVDKQPLWKITLPSLRNLVIEHDGLPYADAPALESLQIRSSNAANVKTIAMIRRRYPRISTLSIDHGSRDWETNPLAPSEYGNCEMSDLKKFQCEGPPDLVIAFLDQTKTITHLSINLSILSRIPSIPSTPSVESLVFKACSFRDDFPLPKLDSKMMGDFLGKFPNLKYLEVPLGRTYHTQKKEEIFALEVLDNLAKLLGKKSSPCPQLGELRCSFWDMSDACRAKLSECVQKAKSQTTIKLKTASRGPRVTFGAEPNNIVEYPYEGRLEWSKFAVFMNSYYRKKG